MSHSSLQDGNTVPMSNATTDAETTAPLVVRDLTVAYARRPVLWNIDYIAPAGGLVAIVGPNGAGKSTFLKAILELVPRAAGHVEFFGRDYREVRQEVAYVPQRTSVDWDFPVTAQDVVAMGLYGRLGWFRPVTRKVRREALVALERVGLAEMAGRQISQLSGGQQQRVFLARAVVQNARFLLLDEPFAGVDAATERTIIELLQQMQAQGRTALVVHHDLQTVPQYFSHVLLLNTRVIAAGTVAEAFTEEKIRQTYQGRLSLLDRVGHQMTLTGRMP